MSPPTRLAVWIRALRPLAQANVAPPIVAGAALVPSRLDRLDLRGLGLSLGFGLLAHAFIVLANDAADAEADAVAGRRTLVSGGSGVVVEGLLSRRTVAAAAAVAAALLVVYAAVWGIVARAPLAPACAAATLVLVWAYSLPPLRRAYADGGAWLQAAGVGLVLPAAGALGQVGGAAGWRLAPFVPLVLFGWAGNVATAIPDADGDARAGKRTLPVRVGPKVARRRAVQVALLAALCSPLAVPDAPMPVHATVEAAAAAVLLAAAAARSPVAFAVALGGTAAAVEITWSLLRLAA